MHLIRPDYVILTDIDEQLFYTSCENAARTCYKSEDKIAKGTAEKMIRNLIRHGHEAMLEHCPNLSVRFICNRSFSHEIIRHRLSSFAQESQRYVKYENSDMEFIQPHWVNDITDENIEAKYTVFKDSCETAEKKYKLLRALGMLAQDARAVLPNAVKTEIVVTANIREWRTIFKLRTEDCADPEMKRLMRPLLLELIQKLPALFEDIPHNWEESL